ncbi:hypothetical protein DQF39_23620, partial [Shigella flexneri]|nr:hypothetical protein [Shigella flexneri]EFV6493024.1 hypothetical protein [Shigella flexneri]EFY4478833.1 hypothetical protein [Shigella flexneri]EFZ6285516.1 hypothetical protein [Shigella flexneri]EGD7350123.1 hypothetical protein [Shigella flexneri]
MRSLHFNSVTPSATKDKQVTRKGIFIQHMLYLECNNLTLRTRIKRLAHKTICFSRSVEIHEKSSAPSLKNTYSTDWKRHP